MSDKDLAKKIFNDALEASLPKNFISEYCYLNGDILYIKDDSYDLSHYKHLSIFGSGKAASTMAFEIERLLGDKIHKGLVVAPNLDNKLKKIEMTKASHPIPDESSLNATKKLMEAMQQCNEDDLYIYLLSGGSSALLELPIEPISLEDFQKTTELMLHNAMDIQEINSVRKHISQIKGGKLAKLSKAQGVVLVLSDVIGNDLHAIGSAPLYADQSSYADAKAVLESKDIFVLLPQSVQEVLEKGIDGDIDETPKAPLESVKHYMLASNDLALKSAYKSAAALGLSVKKIEQPMQGDVRTMVEKIINTFENSSHKCLLFGGECTVEVKGKGRGGRNQHAVALMLQEMKKRDLNITFLSAGTDGIDGNSDAAGAVVNLENAQAIDIQTLQRYTDAFNSYELLKSIDALVTTGATGTNVIDLAIAIKGE